MTATHYTTCAARAAAYAAAYYAARAEEHLADWYTKRVTAASATE